MIPGSLGNVPRDDQHWPRRAAEHAFSDGALSEPLPAASPVGSKDDEISLPGIGVQHDHASRLAVLLDRPYQNSCALCALP